MYRIVLVWGQESKFRLWVYERGYATIPTGEILSCEFPLGLSMGLYDSVLVTKTGRALVRLPVL